MHAGHQTTETRPALGAQGIGRRSGVGIRVTIATNGSWFSVQGDKKDAAGFDLHFSTDGTHAELTIDATEVDPARPVLRLHRDRLT